ncbi:MAG TPA: type II secretion system F family protein [Micromonosporaceae bacterium]|nr:type II secretion system F family protein [Micromonosporaceae bacterium]
MKAGLLAAAALLAASGLLAWPVAGRSTHRLRTVARPRPAGQPGDPRRTARWAALLAGAAVAIVAGGWWGVLAGAAGAAVLGAVLSHLPSQATRQERLRIAADLPLGADLLAAALRAGAPVDRACTAVAAALPGPLGERLGRTGRALRLGAAPEDAWAYLGTEAGCDRLARAAVRSSASGAALAGALVRVAGDLRAGRAAAAEAAARRAGVLVVLPLGLCFLPAFVLAGLLPVIVALLGDVL